MNLQEILNQEGTTIVDVREPYEFEGGHAKGAINIPLGSVPLKLEEFKNMSKPIVVYCKSGNRSGSAMSYLHGQGILQVYNGGGLQNVLFYQRKAA